MNLINSIMLDYKLKPSSNLVTFQTYYFWLNANKIEMNFCLKMCILMSKSLALPWNNFLILQKVGLKMQKSTFLRKNGFDRGF